MMLVLVIDGHEWMQSLPLKDSKLVCMTCDARRAMAEPWGGQSCAQRWSKQRGYVASDSYGHIFANGLALNDLTEQGEK